MRQETRTERYGRLLREEFPAAAVTWTGRGYSVEFERPDDQPDVVDYFRALDRVKLMDEMLAKMDRAA